VNRSTTDHSEVAIYDGRERVGSIVETSKGCQAFGPSGKRIGMFKTRKLALAAINAARTAPNIRSTTSKQPQRGRNMSGASVTLPTTGEPEHTP
jgi:hypothetical protein